MKEIVSDQSMYLVGQGIVRTQTVVNTTIRYINISESRKIEGVAQ